MASKVIALDYLKVSSEPAWVGDVVRYVLARQNEDGGYTFCQGTSSNAQDTYYALEILNLLSIQPPHIQKTIDFLLGLPAYSINIRYYIMKALKICGENPDPNGDLEDFILSCRGSHGGFGAKQVYIEAASEFESTFMATEIINMLNLRIDQKRTIDWILGSRNVDGGFGAYGSSNIISTYHAVASLHNLGYSTSSLNETLAYVKSCEKPYGGFTVVPECSRPYMEHVYCGVLIIDLMGEKCRYPEETANFVLQCHNQNGGFARSDLGISTFEDTFYAVSIMQKLGKI